jgi:surface polysaccharide O-acyltransferase-like enzyme
MFLNSFNYFRGVSILVIVAGHCLDLADIKSETVAEQTIRNLMAGGSTLFVFISGFLFHHVFFEHFNYRHFVTNKARNVLLPYLLLSALPIAYYVISQKPHFDGYFLPTGDGVIAEYVVPSLKYLWTGVFFIPYWYIAFIMLIFLLSPLQVAFIRMGPRLRLTLLTLGLVCAAFLHRPIDNLSPLQSVGYFFPVYLLGIQCSIHKDWIYKNLAGRELILLALVLAPLIWQTLVLGDVGAYNKAPFSFGGIDWVLVQKVFACLLLMAFLHRFENRNWRLLGLLASSSFGIYFLHAWVLAGAYAIKDGREFGAPGFLAWPVATVAVTALSIGAALVARRMLGKRSRMVVGW